MDYFGLRTIEIGIKILLTPFLVMQIILLLSGDIGRVMRVVDLDMYLYLFLWLIYRLTGEKRTLNPFIIFYE